MTPSGTALDRNPQDALRVSDPSEASPHIAFMAKRFSSSVHDSPLLY